LIAECHVYIDDIEMAKAGAREVAIPSSSLPEGLRLACVQSGMRYGGKIITHHHCELLKLCKNGRSVFGSCRYHNVQAFSSDPIYVAEFISTLEKRNGQEAKPRFGAAE
jgi:hypothetical protein